MGKLSYNDKLCMQTLWQVSRPGLCRTAEPVWSTQLQSKVLNSAELLVFVRVTENNGFLTKSLLTKCLHVQFGGATISAATASATARQYRYK